MADLVVLVRIAMGWLGIWLIARGVPPQWVAQLTENAEGIDYIARTLGEGLGLTLALGQCLWWRLAKRLGWAT